MAVPEVTHRDAGARAKENRGVVGPRRSAGTNRESASLAGEQFE